MRICQKLRHALFRPFAPSQARLDRINWLGFISDAEAQTVFSLDNLELAKEELKVGDRSILSHWRPPFQSGLSTSDLPAIPCFHA